MSADDLRRDVVIVGGCGHVGLPLGIALADRGATVALCDINAAAVQRVNDGSLPFREPGAEQPLRAARERGALEATTDAAVISAADVVVVVVATPIDDSLAPDPDAIPRAVAALAPHLRDGQLLVLRSTVYPGVTALVEQALADIGVQVEVAFCPERIAEGRAMVELFTLPQIVSARTTTGRQRAEALFGRLTATIVHLEPEEAELAKLFTNTWRYVKFAIANQLYMIANDAGLDYERIRAAIGHDYPRAADLPSAGFAAGPCLFKDTRQLAAYNNDSFPLGEAAMAVNEGLPGYLVGRISARHDLDGMTVGLLGMAFKAGSDDTRSSLSYPLLDALRAEGAQVLCTDPYVVDDPDLIGLDAVLDQAELLVIGAPHDDYAGLSPSVPVVDVWNLLGRGVLV